MKKKQNNSQFVLLAIALGAAAIGICIMLVVGRLSSSRIEEAAQGTQDIRETILQTNESGELISVPVEPGTEESTGPREPVVTTVKLMAVGDNLIHNMVYNSGMGTDPWNYDHLYQNILKDTEWADVSIINQETIFVSHHENISSYPTFGTPREIGDAVYKAGFDVILHASNHAMDMGIENIYDAIDYWSDKDVTVLGIHKDQQDADTPKIIEVNGIKMGMLNYTYGLNGFVLPAGNEFAVDLLDNEEKLMRDIAYCEEHADITIGFWHMGVEYVTAPLDDAKRVVEKTVAAGCDLLICAHPHVVQPYEMYTAANGNTALVYYSLGNFISAQDEMDRLIGGMAKLTLQKTVDAEGSRVEILDYTMEPLITHVNYGTNFTTYHLEDYSDYLGSMNARVPVTTQRLWNRWYEIVGKPEE